MFALLSILLLVCLVGLIRPFAKLTRKHFGWGAAGTFVLMPLAAPPSPQDKNTSSASGNSQAVLSPAQAIALEKKNTAEITKLKKEAVAAKALDENLLIYSRLAELAPANADYAAKKSEFQAKLDARARYEDHPEEALSLGKVSWHKDGFGSVMIIDRLTVTNDAPFPIKDFSIDCDHYAPSGTKIDSNDRTVYEVVPASGKFQLRNFNMGFIASQAASTSCQVTDAKVS